MTSVAPASSRDCARAAHPAALPFDAATAWRFVRVPIHAATRKYLGINASDPRFDLNVPAAENFNFFNPSAKTGYPDL